MVKYLPVLNFGLFVGNPRGHSTYTFDSFFNFKNFTIMQNVVFTQLSIPELKNLIKEIQMETNQELLKRMFSQYKQLSFKKAERYINKKEAAKVANVCTSTIDNWIRAGRIKKYKLGDAVRIKLSELVQYLDSLAV